MCGVCVYMHECVCLCVVCAIILSSSGYTFDCHLAALSPEGTLLGGEPVHKQCACVCVYMHECVHACVCVCVVYSVFIRLNRKFFTLLYLLYSTFWVGCPDRIFAIAIGNRLSLWYDIIWLAHRYSG